LPPKLSGNPAKVAVTISASSWEMEDFYQALSDYAEPGFGKFTATHPAG